MKQLKKHIMITFLIGIIFLSGCADQLDSILPRDQIAQNQLSESDITKVQNGVYAAMEELIFRYYFDGDVRGDVPAAPHPVLLHAVLLFQPRDVARAGDVAGLHGA